MTRLAPTLGERSLALPDAPAGCYDEYAEAGEPRAHQRRLHDFLQSCSQTIAGAPGAPTELERLNAVLRQRIASHEVTFNMLGAPNGSDRSWQLDPLPLVIARERWEALARGLRQRARVLSEIYADVYGPRRLLSEGVVPPQLVLGNPDFARACCGWEPRGGHAIHLYACDVGSDASGNFSVYSDRAAAPAGAGYALENRLALGGVLNKLFNDYGVHRLRRFFASLDESVHALVHGAQREARVVLLTPGLSDESAFEHAYLARYLGYELAEGRDLTVRDREVYLKTLSGLKKVHVIVRRTHDRWCDAVHLREDSIVGVPGLVEAAAAGNVALLNPLGVAVVEAPGLKPYLDAVCRFFFGEALELPSVPAWWCGDPAAWAYVRDHLDELVFKPSMQERTGPLIRPAQLSAAERSEFLERLESNPGQFVAEAWPGLSSAPLLDTGRLSYGRIAVRTFLCRRGDDYLVMPGGVARVNAPPDGLFLTGEQDGLSKDIWIPSGTQMTNRPPPAMPEGRIELRRGGLELPSRLIDDLYWLGRYTERGDLTARLLRCAYERVGSEASDDAPLALDRILDALQALEILPKGARPGDAEAALAQALGDPAHPASLCGLMHSVHSLSQRTRGRLSRDAWQTLHEIGELIGDPARPLSSDPIGKLGELLLLLSAVRGSTLDNMVRSHAWTFLDMGRRVERGSMMLTVLRVMLAPGAARVHMEVLLEVADSLLTYRARYLSQLQVAPVVDLLLTDESNPRSVVFQATELVRHVSQLPRQDEVRNRAERRAIALQSSLLTLDVVRACSGKGDQLRQALEACSELFRQFSDDVEHTWFSHTSPSHALAVPAWVDEELEAR
jgi:uncharacterized circularly permuted ATP-grasp superfamily protein/uncharacterized alpha-E superfamily protein